MDSFLDSAEMASTDTRVLDKLKDALGRLPVPPEQRQHIHGCAQSLAIVAALFAIQDTPRARVGGSKKARAELELLVELAIDLNNHIQSLHGDTMAFIREQPPKSPATPLGALPMTRCRSRMIYDALPPQQIVHIQRWQAPMSNCPDLEDGRTGRKR